MSHNYQLKLFRTNSKFKDDPKIIETNSLPQLKDKTRHTFNKEHLGDPTFMIILCKFHNLDKIL